VRANLLIVDLATAGFSEAPILTFITNAARVRFPRQHALLHGLNTDCN
jgi:hypothetical protein